MLTGVIGFDSNESARKELLKIFSIAEKYNLGCGLSEKEDEVFTVSYEEGTAVCRCVSADWEKVRSSLSDLTVEYGKNTRKLVFIYRDKFDKLNDIYDCIDLCKGAGISNDVYLIAGNGVLLPVSQIVYSEPVISRTVH